MKTQLTARVTSAGIAPEYMEPRREPDGRLLAYQEKGGWIALLWEVKPTEFKKRTIQVSRDRAVQAMDALDAGRAVG